MKFRWDKKYLYWGITAFFVILSSILFFMFLNNFDNVGIYLNKFISVFMPFLMAFAFAFILNPVVKITENKWFIPLFTKMKFKKQKKISRIFAILTAMLFAITIISGLIVMVIPQLAKSIIGIIDSLPTYLGNLEKWLTQLLDSNKQLQGMLEEAIPDMNASIVSWAKNNLLPQVNNLLSGITVGVIGVFVLAKNLFVAIMVSIYILYSKEKFIAQTKKIIYAIFSVRVSNKILKTTRTANKVFGGFIIGKIIDSAIIGVICFVGMHAFNLISPIDFPFVLLISVIVGVTNVIPFFGPFIGAIPSVLLVLLINPLAAFYFAIFVLALQQLDGNVIGPKILGDSTGLTAFWVIFAIILGGGFFGFTGMLLGVPTFAVLYTIVNDLIKGKLEKRNLPIKTEYYENIDSIEVSGVEQEVENEDQMRMC